MQANSASLPDPWRAIVDLLHDLPANGPDGFEGVVAALLEALTGKPFFVAATGRQPRGDAVSHDVRVSVQAKRYAATTALDANKIMADFHAARAAANYRLDVYVVAVTRETSQLRAELESCQRDTGVDIVVLADDSGSPELSALCVAFWPQVRAFFSSAPTELAAWIETKTNDSTVQAVVARTKTKIGDSLNTFIDLRELARGRMARVFRPKNPDRTQAGVQIRLSDMVERSAPREALLKWWAQEKEPNAYVEAQEGCGKSWVVAAFAEHLATGDTAPAVLWLESLDWTGAKTLDDVVAAGLRTVVPVGDARAEVFASKIFRVWPRPVLLVLDGVNEQGCLDSAQRLLRHYAHHEDHYPKHLRLLFTTRPLLTYPAFRAETWHGVRNIPLGGFTDPEFNEALRRFAPDVPADSIPPNVRAFAAVPRFFRLALRLRDRLRDLGQVTKPVLLFADLIDKIERDSQLRRLFSGTPEATLAHLAKHSQQIDGGVSVVSHQHLAECFPDFTKALEDLAEQRIVLGHQIGKVVVNAEHVVLGFALHLLQLAEASPGDTETALRDRLAAALEPNREDDTRTEALYVALLLSLLRDAAGGHGWDKARRALLFLWCGGHNARRTAERLSFWARTDLPAYRGVVESMFARYLSGGQDTDLIIPIAQRWVKEGTSDEALLRLLSDWLTLVWPGAHPDDSPEEAIERAGYPQAESHEQLRLAFAAISILSLRPEQALLPVLVRCARSCKFCEVTEEMNGKPHKVRLKSPYENLSILLQWNYTERVLPQLIAMAKAAPDNQAIQHGLWVLAECLDLAEIPPELRRPNPPRLHEPRDDRPETIIGEFHQWIHEMPSARIHMPRIWKLELLVEDSFATLTAKDIGRLQVILSRELAKTASHVGRDEVDELFPPIFPWMARFAPTIAQQLSRELWSYAIRSANPTGVALSAPVLPLLPIQLDQLVAEIHAAIDRLRNDKNLGAFLTRFSKVFLVSENEAAIVRWFETMLELPSDRDAEEWRILPVPTMLEKIATSTLAEACWQRFERAQQDFSQQPENRRVRYWLTLYACLVRGDASAGRRALALIRTLPVSHPWAEALAEIVAVSEGATVVDAALRDPEFRRHFADKDATHHFAWFLRLPRATRLSAAVQELLPQLPATVAAELLHWTNGENEHLSFARMLAEGALRRAAGKSGIVEPGFDISWTRAHNDHRAWWEIDETEPESRTSHTALSSVWGVNRNGNGLRQWAESLNGDQDAAVKEQNRRMNDALKRARDKMEAIVDQYLVRFHGFLTLERWATSKPDEFRAFARSFFATLAKNEMNYFDLSVFCDDVLSAMCTLDVAAADQLNDEFYGGSRGTVLINGIVPSFLFRIMAHELDPQEPAITRVRMKLLDRCRSDRDVLATVMAALHGRTISWLRQQAREHFGTSPLAKERAFAVSLLAFAEAPEDRHWLANLMTSDPSGWVRDHAEWAVDVHDQSSKARRLWYETVAEIQSAATDLLSISTRLVRLQALLPPTAILWDRPQGSISRANALVAAFWYTWQNRGGAKAEREICGRKIDQYFRGERVTDVAKRMAPWWQPC